MERAPAAGAAAHDHAVLYCFVVIPENGFDLRLGILTCNPMGNWQRGPISDSPCKEDMIAVRAPSAPPPFRVKPVRLMNV